MLKINYYKDEHGSYPVLDFILEQDEDTQAKILRAIDLLGDMGLKLRKPHNEKIKNSPLWELRIQLGNNIYRILFGVRNEAVLLHGFQKKTQKTPPGMIDLAEKRWDIYLKNLKLQTIGEQSGKKVTKNKKKR